VIAVNLNSELPGSKKTRLALNLPQNELIDKIANTLGPISRFIPGTASDIQHMRVCLQVSFTMQSTIDFVSGRLLQHGYNRMNITIQS